MRRTVLSLIVAGALAAGAAGAVEPYVFYAGVLGGLGGSFDVDPDAGIDHPGLQLNLGTATEPRTLVVLRLGTLELSDDEGFGALTDADLRYATVAGEYRFFRDYYDSGLFAGLGAYRLEGDRPGGGSGSDTALGVVVGTSGEFEISRHFAVLVELAAHWADLDEAQIFGTGHLGIAFRW